MAVVSRMAERKAKIPLAKLMWTIVEMLRMMSISNMDFCGGSSFRGCEVHDCGCILGFCGHP